MKKKILTLGLVAALSATAAIGGTLAYFSDTAEKTNTFNVGNVDIDVLEPNWEAKGKEDAKNVYPGKILDKDPKVTNVGANPCYVRVSVSNLDQYVAEYGAGAIIAREGGSAKWVDGEDGFYYWTEVLNPNATTETLFDKIVIPTQLKNGASAADIVVHADAIQSEGFTGTILTEAGAVSQELKTWFDGMNN